MKLMLSALLSFVLSSAALATPYFRMMDINHPVIGAAILINPKDLSQSDGLTDVAIITHSTADGTICDKLSLAGWCVPSDWSPLQLGLGGSFSGNFILAPGTSVNVAPTLAALGMSWISTKQPGFLGALKSALTGADGSQIRLGIAFAYMLVDNGKFQKPSESLPGHGFFDIMNNALRIDTGYAWKF